MTLAAVFKYTFPISKSEQRADGKYIIGYASGPEVDLEGERMAPDAIQRFADQINSTDGMPLTDRLVYRDAHADDGVMRDLGTITKAWVNEHFHLGIEVKLDEDNPAADFLWKQVSKGKQYGMSVSGRVLDYIDEYVAALGKVVRTYKNVVLDEISNTTRPAWYPSFGSVLSKSIKDAAQSAGSTGENTLDEDELLDTPVEDTAKSDESVTDEADTTSKADDSADESGEVDKYSAAASDAASASYTIASLSGLLGSETDEGRKAYLRSALEALQAYQGSEIAAIGSDEDKAESGSVYRSEDEADGEDEIAKAGRRISAADSKKLLDAYATMTTTLTDLGLLGDGESSDKSDSGDEEDTLDKSTEATADDGRAALEAQVVALSKANTEMAARVEELEKAPKTSLPSLVTDETKKSEEAVLSDILSKASPSERMRLAMALHTQGR